MRNEFINSLCEKMTMNIRKANFSEYEAIANVHAASFHAMHKGLIPEAILAESPVETFILRWKERLSKNETITYVAELNQQIVGLITFVNPDLVKHDSVEGVEFKFLYIRPDYWRQGIGRALSLAALKELRKAGFHSIHFWVLANNPQSKNFYAKFGATADGTDRTAIGDHGIYKEPVRQLRYTLRINTLIPLSEVADIEKLLNEKRLLTFHRFMQLQVFGHGKLNEYLLPYGITYEQWCVLRAVHHQPLSSDDLLQQLKTISMEHLTTLLAELHGKHCITYQHDSQDLSSIALICITSHGKTLYQKAEKEIRWLGLKLYSRIRNEEILQVLMNVVDDMEVELLLGIVNTHPRSDLLNKGAADLCK